MKHCFKVTIRPISKTPSCKEGVCFVEEVYSLRIGRPGKSIAWEVCLEVFEDFKIMMVSFYLAKHKNNSKIRKFHRNSGKHCIDPMFTLSLFRNCLDLCLSARDESYAFGFYALDDDQVTMKEDINKRMSSYHKFIKRIALSRLEGFQQAGNVLQNLLVIYNPNVTDYRTVEHFIQIYHPIIEAEVKELYGARESHKLKH